MTSASIMEMSKAGFAVQGNMLKAPPANAGTQFSDAMDFASASQQGESTEVTPSSGVKEHAEKSAAQHTGRKEIREVEQTEEKPEVSKEEVSEKMDAKEEEIVKEIAEQFGVSEEEVREALEVLGFGVMDLLSQGNMVSLVAQLTDMQTVSVLTDETLFAQITEMTAQVSEELQSVADSLGMSLEQLQTMVEEQATAKEEVQVLPVSGKEGAAKDSPIAEPEAEADTVQESARYEAKAESAEQGKEVPLKVSGTVQEEPEMPAGQNKQDEGESQMMQAGQNVQTLKGEMNVEIPGQEAPVFERSMDMEQTRELINQIAEHVRVNRSETLSSMEIQLHPVELGTVNLQVMAKDGTVSARLAVQDEAVRAALESQVAQLRETLQQQGLRIDAVEVTVATHEFEQNLDQHGRDAEENAAKEKKNGRKILDLNEIGQEDFEGGEMSEADRLQVEMMRMGGNRLNLRA